MPARNQHSLHMLLAPSRLVSGVPMRNGYGMGVAATVSGELTIEFPEFELAEDDLVVAERALAAVVEAYDLWRWKPCGWWPIPDQFWAHQEWLAKLHAAAAKGDRYLPALIRRGFVLTVTTSRKGHVNKKGAAPKRFSGFPAPTYPYAAAVSVQHVP